MTYELHTETREIDGVTFRITRLPFKKSRATLLLLGRKVILPLQKAVGGASLGGAMGDDSGKRAATLDAIGAVVSGLDLSDLEKLDEAFGSHSWFQHGTDAAGEPKWVSLGTDEGRELAFRSSTARYFQWLLACAEVTYRDFFAGRKSQDAPS